MAPTIDGAHWALNTTGREGGTSGWANHWTAFDNGRFITGTEYWMFFTQGFDV